MTVIIRSEEAQQAPTVPEVKIVTLGAFNVRAATNPQTGQVDKSRGSVWYHELQGEKELFAMVAARLEGKTILVNGVSLDKCEVTYQDGGTPAKEVNLVGIPMVTRSYLDRFGNPRPSRIQPPTEDFLIGRKAGLGFNNRPIPGRTGILEYAVKAGLLDKSCLQPRQQRTQVPEGTTAPVSPEEAFTAESE